MNPSSDAPWQVLFAKPSRVEDAVNLRFRLIRKHGHPLLLVPTHRAAVRETMALYPAQTRKAKAGRRLVTFCLRLGLPLGSEPVELQADSQAPFWKFLRSCVEASNEFSFALLCGNPHVPGRRLVILLFDETDRPRKLVKVGVGKRAEALIAKETAFLKTAPEGLTNAPAVEGEFRAGDTVAVALQYAAGANPGPNEPVPLARLLTSWLHPSERTPLAELPAWRRLAKAAQGGALFHRLNRMAASSVVRPAIFHGDLAPWNIRVDPTTRSWTVLDWERGEPAGPPVWDWVYFLIQIETLVRRARSEQVAGRLEALFESAEFQAYARQAEVGPIVRPLAAACVLYGLTVMPPAEGTGPLRSLLNLIARRWPHA